MPAGRFGFFRSLLAQSAVAVALSVAGNASAFDLGDGVRAANDPTADLGDAYFFLDPNDPTMLVMITTLRGYMVPAQTHSLGQFDPAIRTRFAIEITGKNIPDSFVDVTFSQIVDDSQPQTANITYSNKAGTVFFTAQAPTTVAVSDGTAPAPVVTDLGNGWSFFAGAVDDPTFFDKIGFERYLASLRSGTPDGTLLDRQRDSFAGYNTLAIAIRAPVAQVQGPVNRLGLTMLTVRYGSGLASSNLGTKRTIDRVANPGMSNEILPFASRDLYNAKTTIDDFKLLFAPTINASLTALGTDTAHKNTIKTIYYALGDIIRLHLDVANTGPGGGSNPEAAWPNGRRLGDDVADTLLNIITNGTVTTGDHVDTNDQPFGDTFPFLAPQQVPYNTAEDDNTRN